MLRFTLEQEDKETKARAAIIETAHGRIKTPIFMPVGTVGSVKTLTPHELEECGASIILGNTYHLYLRPGMEVLDKFDGLHNFMSWNKNILTDSGGFQVFSLAELRDISEEGVYFKSHLNGKKFFMSPEISMEIQKSIGSDIVMAFDECVSCDLERSYFEKSVVLTTNWAKRCKNVPLKTHQSLFGIIQGGIHKDLRKKSAEDITEIGFDGYAIGGLSVGETIPQMYEITDYTTEYLPKNAPRYLMGVGSPEDILNCIASGVDMFDCVMPTRNARNGMLFTSSGKLHIKREQWKLSDAPIDSECECYTCRNFSKGYLRHLYKSGEILALRLNTIHNINFYLSLVKGARNAIKKGCFETFKNEMIEKMTIGGDNV